jgi:hypothetical protein
MAALLLVSHLRRDRGEELVEISFDPYKIFVGAMQ